MNLKQELINRLGVPENWDKYDYKTQRYSFDDMQEVLDDIVKKSSIPVVVLSFDELKNETKTFGNILLVAFFLLILVGGSYKFGKELNKDILYKKEMIELEKEKLRLEIELKKLELSENVN